MANETNFFSKKLLLWPEAAKGVTPSPIPKAYGVTALSFSLIETQKTETNPVLGNGGQGSATDFGASDFAGNVECKYTGGIMPILANHIIGKAVKTNMATTTWVTLTIHAIGDVVNSVAGTASLVCKIAGTTGAVEPTYVGLVDGDLIVDGSVTWVYRSVVLKKYIGSLSPCLETIGIEMQSQTGCELTPVTFTERFTGVFFNSFELSKSGGNVIYKYSLPALAMGQTDSAKVGFTPLTITNELAIIDNAYGYDDLIVTVGGVEPVNCNSFRMTINRNTALEMGVKLNERIDNTPIVTVDGEMVLKFTVEQYTALYNNPSKEVILVMSKVNGDYAKFTFPAVETLRAPLTYATDKPVYLSAKLNAKGSTAIPTVNYEVHSTTDWN